MRADLILGFDPVPADETSLVSLSHGLRTVIRALVEARLGLGQLGRSGSVWDGPAGAPVATLLRRYSQQLSALEEPLVDYLRVVDVWRYGSQERQGQVAEIVEAVADLAGQPDADDRRTRLIATAAEIGLDHERAASGRGSRSILRPSRSGCRKERCQARPSAPSRSMATRPPRPSRSRCTTPTRRTLAWPPWAPPKRCVAKAGIPRFRSSSSARGPR